MTARPSGAFCEYPVAMGTIPRIMADAVMSTGAKAGCPGFDRGPQGVAVLLEPVAGIGDDEDRIGGRRAHAHDGARERGFRQTAYGSRTTPTQCPPSAPGKAVMMMKGSSQDWKLTTISR